MKNTGRSAKCLQLVSTMDQVYRIVGICILIVTWVSIGECTNFEEMACPIWMHPDTSSSHHSCVCGDRLGGVIRCDQQTSRVNIKRYYCIFFSKELNITLIGSCPYSYGGMLPMNVSQLTDEFTQCSHLRRKGQLCGECADNYTLPVYSYNLGCVACKSFRYGWIKFIAVAFFPLTVFYTFVIIFRISVTSSALNGFVMVSQIIATPALVQFLYTDNHINSFYHVSYSTQMSVDLIIAIYAIWNLDFFRSLYKPICLHPFITYPQVLLLDYCIAVYPLLLILITFVLVKINDSSAFVRKLWWPFHKCLVMFRKQWNVHSSLVNALATFIILSYVKILNVSFQLLMPSRVYDIDGNSVNIPYLYCNGTIIMTSKEYHPYLVLALLMVLIFNVIPLLLLAFYPFNCFQRILDICCRSCLKYKLSLQIFMDAFHGCYDDFCRHYRHFATLYLAMRFFNLVLYSVFNYKLYLLAASLMLTFTVVLVAMFQPYRNKYTNKFDVVCLLAVIPLYTSMLMQLSVSPMVPKWVNGVVATITGLTPVILIICLTLATLMPKAWKCFVRGKVFLVEKLVKQLHNKCVEEQTSVGKLQGSNYHTL